MAWLRIDDGFADHPKILGLTDRELRVWVGVLCYCARHRTDGKIPESAQKTLGISTRIRSKLVEKALVEEHDHELQVHDWNVYNLDPTNADRQARFRAKRNVTRNGEVTPKVTPPSVTDNAPRAQARARGPSPKNSPTERALTGSLSPESPSPPNPPRPPAPDGAAVEDLAPDPEALARIAAIWNNAAKKAHAEQTADREEAARLDTPQANARRAAAKAKLEELRANA